MNDASSRSHLIFSIIVDSTNVNTNVRTIGKLSFVDLAGSEKSSKTGTDAEGQAEANARIELFDGTTSLGTTTASANGAFSLDVTLAAGARSITAKAIDAAGNVGAASAALAITVDTTAPAAPTGSGGIPAIQLSAIASGS